MKPKHLLVLAVILTFLVMGVVAKQFYKAPEIATEEYAALDLSFDIEKVGKFEIGKGKDKLVELSKAGERRWIIPTFLNARADEDKIKRFLNAVREAKGEIRARDRSLFEDFGISDEQAYFLLLSDDQGSPILKILLGEKKPKYDAVFLRKADADVVYYVDADLFSRMGLSGDPAKEKPTSDYWASLGFVDFEVDQVNLLEAVRFGKLLVASLLRESEPGGTQKKWKYLRPDVPFSPDAEKIKTFLTNLKFWKASGVVDPTGKDMGFQKSELQIKLGFEKETEILLTFGQKAGETGERYLKVTGEPVVYKIADYNFKNMNIDDSQFFVDNPLDLKPEKTEKIVIRADKKKVTLSPKKKKDETVTGYLNDIQGFSISRLLFEGEEKGVESPARFSLEIQKEGAPIQILDVGGIVSEEKKEYAAKMRHSPQAFAISEILYKKLFDNLDRFK